MKKAMSFTDLIPVLGSMWYIFLNMGIVIAAMVPYLWIRKVYVYKEDRDAAAKPEMVVKEKVDDYQILEKLDEVVRRVSAAHLAESIKHKEF